MFGNTYTAPPSSDMGMLALLSLLNDKGASAKRLQELTKAQTETQESIEKNQQIQQETRDLKKQIDEAQAKLDSDRKDHESKVADQVSQLKAKEQELSSQSKALAVMQQKGETLYAELDSRKAELDNREKLVKLHDNSNIAKEMELKKREEKIAEYERKHQRRLVLLQEILKD